jgi:hypothetical protein
MKPFCFFIFILIGMIFPTGCGGNIEEPRREFYTNFSIGRIVDQNKEYLLENPTDSSGELLPGSRIVTGSEAGPPEPFIQRYEEINFQIDDADQTEFMLKIKMDIEREIVESGAEVQGYGQGGGTGSEYFSFDYSYDQAYGTIHIWAVRGPDSNMNMIALLTEN